MAERTDAELVEAAGGGDRSAYGELVTRYQGHVYGLAYSLTGDWASAQDISQEAFIRAYLNLDQLRRPDRFAPWLRRVAFSAAMEWLKAFRPGLHELLEEAVDLDRLEMPDFRPGPSAGAERRELAEAVLQAVASLPPKYRVPLTMFHLDGLSYRKVAAFLDIPLGTARSLVCRARRQLREMLAQVASGEVEALFRDIFDEHKPSRTFLTRFQWVPGGAMLGCLNYLGRSVSAAWLHAHSSFVLNVSETVSADSPDTYVDEGVVPRLMEDLGCRVERFETVLDGPDAGRKLGAARARLQEAVDAGIPCCLWEYAGDEWRQCIVTSYDDAGYRVLDDGSEIARPWSTLGRNRHNWLEFSIVHPASRPMISRTSGGSSGTCSSTPGTRPV
jgi:RNA polymerase sigma-70 factor (ECF subfamily)